MMKNLLCCALIAIVCAGCSMQPKSSKMAECQKSCCSKECPKMLRHVVLFKFKEGTTPEKIKEVQSSFAALPSEIDLIKGFEMGTDVSVEKRSEGFTHVFVVTFSNEAGRDAYLVHPAHKEFGKSLGGCLDKVLVIDYWTK